MLLHAFQQWFQSGPGSWLLQFEQEQVNKWLPLVRGASVLQIGGLPDTFQVGQQCNQEYYFLTPNISDEKLGKIDIFAGYDELPFQPNSLNLVLLVHVLEFVEQPSVVLKEIFDALAPNGKLLLFCFNPWSLWGVYKLFASKKEFPWSGKFISPARLQQWLTAIGYTNIRDKTLCYRAPFVHKPLTRSALFVEALGQIAFPLLGAVTVLLLEKRIYGFVSQPQYHWQKQQILKGS